MPKTVTFLCEHRGANSYSRHSPVAVWRGQVDLGEKTWACLSFDDDRLVEVPRWSLREVELPDWLDPEEYLRFRFAWEWLWGFGVERDWPEPWQRSLLAVKARDGEAALLACIELLTTRSFRSAFRASLHDQLVAWLETPEEDRRYDSPFSRRQWEALLHQHHRIEARRLSNALYYATA